MIWNEPYLNGESSEVICIQPLALILFFLSLFLLNFSQLCIFLQISIAKGWFGTCSSIFNIGQLPCLFMANLTMSILGHFTGLSPSS